MQLVIEVPDDSPLATDINSWQDGMKYELGVTQTSTGAFTLDTAEAADADEAPEAENNEGDTAAPDAGSENPAMSGMMAMKRGMK